MHLQAGGHEGLDCAPIRWVFQPHGVMRVGQQLGAQTQRLLGAARHNDLFYIHRHAARDTQIVGDGAAQRPITPRAAVVQHIGVGHAPVFVLQALPQRHRESAEVSQARGKGLHLQISSTKSVAQCVAALRQLLKLRRCRSGARRVHVRQVGVHKRATADPADQVALHRQLVQRRHHRVARQAKVVHQLTAGRQSFACVQFAAEQGAAHGLVQQAVQGPGVVWLEPLNLAE